jgi:hypothetical protein
MARRRREAEADLDRMTIAVNHGYVMAGNPEAARAWNARHESSAPQSVAEYRSTAARLAARFPGAVKMLVH